MPIFLKEPFHELRFFENRKKMARPLGKEEIVSSQRKEWHKWVQEKIDQGDFRNLVLKLEKTGQKEIDLNETQGKLLFK